MKPLGQSAGSPSPGNSPNSTRRPLRTTLGGALTHFRAVAPKGEFVLVVEGAPAPEEALISLEDAVQQVLRLQEEHQLKTKEAIRRVAADTGLAKNELYDAVLKARSE